MSRFLVKNFISNNNIFKPGVADKDRWAQKAFNKQPNLNIFSQKNQSSLATFFRWHLGFLLLFTWTFPAIFSIPLFVAYGKFLSFTYGKFWSLSHIFISSLKDFLIFGIQTSEKKIFHRKIWLHELFSFRDRCTQWQNLRLFLRSILQ